MKAIAKSDETRARILNTALDLFRRQGFEGTTMRQIAAAAGLAAGAAYYYFDSKDAIVLAFYDQAQREMEPLLEQALEAATDLRQRIQSVIAVKLRYFEPSRQLLSALSVHTNPAHPLSPFNDVNRPIRDKDMDFFDRALTLSNVRDTEDLRPHLPRLLWLYQMGLILFWVFDRSDSQAKTQALLDKSVRLVARLIKLSGLPPMRPLRRIAVDLVQTVVE
ncbi:MAG TPA: TetR family transcriptional regulator [Bryobacteraceae bacterium]|nr:TetR family transcriptional regulator [Bryobacteraceae bacterium]